MNKLKGIYLECKEKTNDIKNAKKLVIFLIMLTGFLFVAIIAQVNKEFWFESSQLLF